MSLQGAWSAEASRAAALQGRDNARHRGIWEPHPSSRGHTSAGQKAGEEASLLGKRRGPGP